jgi:hypothetical protein
MGETSQRIGQLRVEVRNCIFHVFALGRRHVGDDWFKRKVLIIDSNNKCWVVYLSKISLGKCGNLGTCESESSFYIKGKELCRENIFSGYGTMVKRVT